MNVLIFGTGTMGTGITQVLANSANVSAIAIYSNSRQKFECLKQSCEKKIDKMVSKGLLAEEDALLNLNKINFIDNTSDLTPYDLIIEAIVEDLEIKTKLFERISASIRPDALVASNTSSISISALSSSLLYPQNLIGMHFFNPAPVMGLIEIIAGYNSSEDAVQRAFNFAKSINKTPVLVNESPGFVVNRMLIPMINEAICILSENVASAEDIDKSMMLGANHPMGPLKLSDLIGNDVVLSIMDTLYTETGDSKYRASTLLRRMVRCKHLGRKSGIGFYNYS